MTITAA